MNLSAPELINAPHVKEGHLLSVSRQVTHLRFRYYQLDSVCDKVFNRESKIPQKRY